MADIASQPSSPAEWKQYANSDLLSTLPSSANERQEDKVRGSTLLFSIALSWAGKLNIIGAIHSTERLP